LRGEEKVRMELGFLKAIYSDNVHVKMLCNCGEASPRCDLAGSRGRPKQPARQN
jgi:hypothetical protein